MFVNYHKPEELSTEITIPDNRGVDQCTWVLDTPKWCHGVPDSNPHRARVTSYLSALLYIYSPFGGLKLTTHWLTMTCRGSIYKSPGISLIRQTHDKIYHFCGNSDTESVVCYQLSYFRVTELKERIKY